MSIIEGAKQAVQGIVQGAMTKAVALAPDNWIPGGVPDPLIRHQNGHIGKPLSRIDGPLKVSGQARFAAEFPVDRMLYAALVHSTIAKGKITRLDTADAEGAPGVVAVMTHRNAPQLKPAPVQLASEKGAAGNNCPVMQDANVRWNGEPIALVLAETQEQAEYAAALIAVEYDEEESLTSFAHAIEKGTKPGVFMGAPLHNEKGDAKAALVNAATSVDSIYTTPRHSHNAIELHGVTVSWQGNTLYVHDATQMVAHTAWSLAQIFGLKEEQVIVTSPFVGGGFGGKGLWQHQILAAASSKLVGRPVRLVLSREGVYRTVGGRSLTQQRVALGAGADGKLTTLIHSGTTALTPGNVFTEPFILQTRSAYESGTFLLDIQTVALDMIANMAMRAPGESVGTFALECAMDELAEKLDMDPIELRLLNEPLKDPLLGLPFSGRHLDEAWRNGAKKFGWDRRKPAPRSRKEGEWLIGMGCATGTYPYYRFPGGAARITLTADGKATVDIAAHEMGMGTATAQTQISAERLGLPLDAVTFNYGDSTLPGLVIAGGSQQTAAIGGSVIAAYRALVEELLKLAGNDSPLAGLGLDEVASRDGGLCKVDDEDRFESYVSILSRARRSEVCVEVAASDPLEMGHWSMHSHSAVFAEVRVNAVTGEIRVTRFLGSFDCGRIMNPKTAASQFRGGIIMGLGMALMEETQFDERKGRVMNPSLAEYHVPVHMDVPEIDVMWTDIPDPHTPMGARGVGEIGITGVAAAVANAVYNATGKRVRDLPITLDKVLF